MLRVVSVCLGVAVAGMLGACGQPAQAPVVDISTSPVAVPSPTPEPIPTSTDVVPVSTTTTVPPAPTTTLVDVPFTRNESYYFLSPDGNFTCGIVRLPNRTEAGCEGVTTPVPPRPEDCMVSWGNGIRVEDTGPAAFMCSGGQVYTSGTGADAVLPPGTELARLGYTCTTTATSVTCANDETGHGFTIAPELNELF